MNTDTIYQWLEPKPSRKSTRQWGIKGRNMTVWNLVAPIVVRDVAPEDIARRFDLPLDAVHEALAYYFANKEWIHAEVDEEGRQLGLK